VTPQMNVIVPCLPLICAEPKPFEAIEEAYRNSVIWITKNTEQTVLACPPRADNVGLHCCRTLLSVCHAIVKKIEAPCLHTA
jgi:hypothetical protein